MGFWEFVGKTAATIATGIVLGPAAIPVGAAVWGVNKVVQETCDDEDVKKIFGTLGDIGCGVALGSIGGEILGAAAEGIGSQAAREIARNGGRMTNGAKVLMRTEKVVSVLGEACEAYQDAKDDYDNYYKPIAELIKHQEHRRKGIKYQYDCEVCNA